MKILFVQHSIGLTGGHRAVLEISKVLSKKGCQTAILHPIIHPHFLDYSKPNTYFRLFKMVLGRIFRGNKIKWFQTDISLFRCWNLHTFVKSISGKHFLDQYDIIVLTSWETANAFQSFNNSKSKIIYFVQHYEAWFMWNNLDYYHGLENPVDMPASRILSTEDMKLKDLVDETYFLADTIFTTSKFLVDLLTKNFNKDNLVKIPIGNNFELFLEANTNKKNNPKTVLFNFRGIPWKGDTFGISVLELLNKKRPDININIYGKLRQPERLKKFANVFKNPDDKELQGLYQAADLFLFTSRVEGWGSPPMEAMASKCALVSTRVGFLIDYGVENENCKFINFGDVHGTVETIINLIDDEKKLAKLSKSGADLIKTFTWEESGNQFFQACENTLSSKIK